MNCELCGSEVRTDRDVYAGASVAACECSSVSVHLPGARPYEKGFALRKAWDKMITEKKSELLTEQLIKNKFKNKHKHRAKISKLKALYRRR